MPNTSLVDTQYNQIVRNWRKKEIQTRVALASELAEYRVYFAYHSGRIENQAITYHDTREVFENGRAVGFTGDVRTLFEIQNLKECHECLLDAYQAQEPLDEPFVRKLQGVLTKGTYDEVRWRGGERPGEYKHDLLVLNNHPPIVVFDEDKMAYYACMEIWDEEADLEPMKEFLKAELVKTWTK